MCFLLPDTQIANENFVEEAGEQLVLVSLLLIIALLFDYSCNTLKAKELSNTAPKHCSNAWNSDSFLALAAVRAYLEDSDIQRLRIASQELFVVASVIQG